MKKFGKIFFIVCLTFLLVNCLNQKVKSPLEEIFPISFFQIQSGSMMPQIQVGEVVVLLKKKQYKENEIITYQVDNSYFITHRIVEITKEGYITKGDFNNTEDEITVTLEQIQGKVIFHSKILGKIIEYRFYIIGILIFLLLLEIRKEEICHKK